MTHDPLCPELWRYEDGQPCMFCALITRVREDALHRLMRDDDYAYVATQSYAAALRDAVNAIQALGPLSHYRKELGDDGYPIFWLESVDAVAAIQALGGKQ